jgi:hypothetical protein
MLFRLDTYLRAVPLLVSFEVCQTSRSALADLLARMYFWTRESLSRSLVARHPCWTAACFLPCTRPPDITRLRRLLRFFSQLLPSAHRSALALKDLRSAASNRLGTVFAVFQQFCLLDWAPCIRRATSSLLQAFSPPHSEGYNIFQGPHILYDRPSFPAFCD